MRTLCQRSSLPGRATSLPAQQRPMKGLRRRNSELVEVETDLHIHLHSNPVLRLCGAAQIVTDEALRLLSHPDPCPVIGKCEHRAGVSSVAALLGIFCEIQVITIVWMVVEACVSLSAAWVAQSPCCLPSAGTAQSNPSRLGSCCGAFGSSPDQNRWSYRPSPEPCSSPLRHA